MESLLASCGERTEALSRGVENLEIHAQELAKQVRLPGVQGRNGEGRKKEPNSGRDEQKCSRQFIMDLCSLNILHDAKCCCADDPRMRFS